MKVLNAAIAGTLESSDAQVSIEPGDGTLEINVESSVVNQFGRQIKATVLESLERLEITDAKVSVVDKGALSCTLKARVEGAVFRACGYTEEDICGNPDEPSDDHSKDKDDENRKKLPWGGAIR